MTTTLNDQQKACDAHPIPMLLFCPHCGEQHIDAPEEAECDGEIVQSIGWANPPHRSHLCHVCGTVWRPADVPTTGVASITTKGKADSWRVIDAPATAAHAGVITEADIDRIADETISAWAHEGRMPQMAWDFRGLIKDGVHRALSATPAATAPAAQSTAEGDEQ
jgi:hypothetical protein